MAAAQGEIRSCFESGEVHARIQHQVHPKLQVLAVLMLQTTDLIGRGTNKALDQRCEDNGRTTREHVSLWFVNQHKIWRIGIWYVTPMWQIFRHYWHMADMADMARCLHQVGIASTLHHCGLKHGEPGRKINEQWRPSTGKQRPFVAHHGTPKSEHQWATK